MRDNEQEELRTRHDEMMTAYRGSMAAGNGRRTEELAAELRDLRKRYGEAAGRRPARRPMAAAF